MRRLLFLIILGTAAYHLLRAGSAQCVRPAPARTQLADNVFAYRDDDGRRIDVHDGWGRRITARTHAPSVAYRDDQEREIVGDIPVPIVPGTRVTDAQVQPPVPPRRARRPVPPQPPRAIRLLPAISPAARTITGRLSASEDRARDDARLQLDRAVADWLSPDVPHAWKPRAAMINRLMLATEVHPVEKDLGTMYEATIRADFSPHRRTEIVRVYEHELVAQRLTLLGGVIAFVLACLAALAGYIKADEATKGYYTNRLRLAAAAGVGAAGVAIYQLLS